ncbi:MAG: MgtC/SapB family protein [Candidatus Niyogibacteria bacterium]|nr:MgtC/SapB family protein [Candidatus Niyogibacteria bacterium]
MDDLSLRIIFQIILAALLGLLIGYEREHSHKEAGTRTYSLIAMGAALFTILSYEGLRNFSGLSFDPSRIASNIVIGVGFIGGGLIFLKNNRVSGLTTAAGVWATAAIGMAVGFQMYWVAFASTVLVLTILFVLWLLEKKLTNIKNDEENGGNNF